MRLTENELLFAEMKRKKLTMSKIGEALGISESTVSKAFSMDRPAQFERIRKFIRNYKPDGREQ